MKNLPEFEDDLTPRHEEGPAVRRARAAGIDVEQLDELRRLTPIERLRRLEEAIRLAAVARDGAPRPWDPSEKWE